jgi:hypothetical protein
MKKDITNKNPMGQYHGYQEWYSFYDNSIIHKLSYRAIWNNGKRIRYIECHLQQKTTYYIK